MEKTLKIFISCALGAGIGTMVSSEINGYFWWLGLLAGGLTGYLSYEFRKVLVAIRTAWYQVIGYRPNWDLIMRRFWGTLSGMSLLISALVFGGLVALGIYHLVPGSEDLKSPLALLGFFTYHIPGVPAFFKVLSLTKEKEGGSTTADIKRTLLYTNPVAILLYWPFKVLIKTPRAIVKGVKLATPYAKRGIGRLIIFVKTVFILIHSELRLLCGVDAAIGAAIGYLAGSVFIGMITGGIVGILNYEIISRRILHLAPLKSK